MHRTLSKAEVSKLVTQNVNFICPVFNDQVIFFKYFIDNVHVSKWVENSRVERKARKKPNKHSVF